MSFVQLSDVEAARVRIAPYIRPTPHVWFDYLNGQGGSVLLKLESLQQTGSFKLRGASNCVLANLERAKERGVVAASAGNHSQGVARICQALNVDAIIVMPETTPALKVQNTQRFGARVELQGGYFDQSFVHASAIAQRDGRLLVPAFYDPYVVAGQGTVALELIEDKRFDDAQAVVIPIGGGGLGVGIATVLRQLRPDLKIYGVTPENAPSFYNSYKKGTIEEAPVSFTLAEGTATKRPEIVMVNEVRRLFDDVFSLPEESIARAVALLAEHGKCVVEGSGALPLAAYLEKRFPEKRVTLILSGGNIDPSALQLVLQRGLAAQERLVRYHVVVPDRPGSLLMLVQVCAERGANVKQVFHQRSTLDLPFGETQIEVEVETRGPEHTRALEQALVARQLRFSRAI